MSLLECRCRLRYPTGFVLDVDFSTDAWVTALVGPSGSGKTSILSMIAGLRRPDDGRICLNDRTLFDGAARIELPPEQRRIGYVFQEGLLFPHLTVKRNLLYGQRRRQPAAPKTGFDHVVQVLEIGELLTRWPHSLSGGQRQRVALGRALLCGPDLLLLDEPLASLDQDLKGRVLSAIERILKDFRIPALFVSHDPEEVRSIAQRVIEVRQGRIVAMREPPDLVRVRGKDQ